MQIASQVLPNDPQERWQVYEPRDTSQSVFKAFNKEIKNLLILTIALSALYLIITLLSPFTILTVAVLVVASFMLLKINFAQLKKQGLVNKLSPKLRQLLLEKSIFDIYSDLLYFPLITKIIGAFLKPLLMKPHPHQLHHTFQNLPNNIQLAIARKGLLSLAPPSVQKMFVSSQTIAPIPQKFAAETWEWKNYPLYRNHPDQVHEQTIVKKAIERIDEKVSWKGFMGMAAIVGFGVYKNPSRFKKILVQNGIFVAMIFLFFIIAIKLKKRSDVQTKNNEEQTRIESLKISLLSKDD